MPFHGMRNKGEVGDYPAKAADPWSRWQIWLKYHVNSFELGKLKEAHKQISISGDLFVYLFFVLQHGFKRRN